MMKIWLGTPEQKTAACMVLLMAGLCIFDYKEAFDVPHLHVEGPLMSTVSVGFSASASNTTSVSTYSSFDWRSGP